MTLHTFATNHTPNTYESKTHHNGFGHIGVGRMPRTKRGRENRRNHQPRRLVRPRRRIPCVERLHAGRSIDELLMHHRQDIGSENALNIAQLKCHIAGLGGKFDYAAAAMTAKDVADRLETQEAESDLYRRFEDTYRFYDKFRDIPAPEITRPDRDVTVPIEIERVKLPTHIDSKGWRGTTIYVPVTANGKTYRFIFDTGAGTSFISESMAETLDIQAIADSVAVNANMPGTMFGKMGTTDSLQIGEMTLHNPLFTIVPPNALDSVIS